MRTQGKRFTCVPIDDVAISGAELPVWKGLQSEIYLLHLKYPCDTLYK